MTAADPCYYQAHRIAETLNNQFQKVFTTPDRDPLPNQPMYTVDKPMLPITVNKDDIKTRLKNLDQDKYVGLGGYTCGN